jgi:hypothetical protein
MDIGDRQAFLDEVARWKTRWNIVDEQKPQTLLETLNVTNQDLYHKIYAICTVLITMPVSLASSERSFSAMHRIKNCLRATMGDERLSNLSLLHIHRTRNLSVEDVINKGVGMIRVDFGPISETVYIDIILNTIIER